MTKSIFKTSIRFNNYFRALFLSLITEDVKSRPSTLSVNKFSKIKKRNCSICNDNNIDNLFMGIFKTLFYWCVFLKIIVGRNMMIIINEAIFVD